MSFRLILLLLVFTGVGCNGPVLLLPGGGLDGEPAATPPDWAFAGASGTVQLETRPEDPYSVNLAFTVVEGQLYINAGDSETQWVKNIAINARVRLRLNGALYDLRAEPVTDAGEIATFGKAWTGQSMFRRDPTEFEVVWIYRLVSR